MAESNRSVYGVCAPLLSRASTNAVLREEQQRKIVLSEELVPSGCPTFPASFILASIRRVHAKHVTIPVPHFLNREVDLPAGTNVGLLAKAMGDNCCDSVGEGTQLLLESKEACYDAAESERSDAIRVLELMEYQQEQWLNRAKSERGITYPSPKSSS